MARTVIDEINDWYRAQSTGASGQRSARFERINDDEVWIEFDLSETKLEGYLLDPFVHDLGHAGWIQGWADGWTLSIAVPCRSVSFVLGFLQAIR